MQERHPGWRSWGVIFLDYFQLIPLIYSNQYESEDNR